MVVIFFLTLLRRDIFLKQEKCIRVLVQLPQPVPPWLQQEWQTGLRRRTMRTLSPGSIWFYDPHPLIRKTGIEKTCSSSDATQNRIRDAA
ncbi:MAG: hypothetical protein MZU91_08925 [Desulfosudis oleivorans]|nr:hypothetical protein [Desulfosudis oleivorans]